MKKVIRLTESELTKLIKRVIQEQATIKLPMTTGGNRWAKAKSGQSIKEQSEMSGEPNDGIIGKSVTLYLSKGDAVAAAKAGKSNSQAEGSLLGVIKEINKINSNGLELQINLDDISDVGKKNLTSGGYYFVYNRQYGSFLFRSNDSFYYNESLKNALENSYFRTDFASAKKTSGTQATAESRLVRLANRIINEAMGIEPILNKKTKIFGTFFFGEGKTKPSSLNGLNGGPITQADIDFIVRQMATFIKDSGTLNTLQNFSSSKVGVYKNSQIPKFITLSIGTSHTGSGETNSSVAQGRYNFLTGMVMKAFDLLGVDSAVAKSVIITNTDSAYSPSNLDKNTFDPKKLSPEDAERWGAITINALVTKGNDTRGIQNIQRGLNSASSIINNVIVDGVDEQKIVDYIRSLQTFSDIQDLDDAINAGGKWPSLERFLNSQLFDDPKEMREVVTHLQKLAAGSGKQKDTIRLLNKELGMFISIGLGA